MTRSIRSCLLAALAVTCFLAPGAGHAATAHNLKIGGWSWPLADGSPNACLSTDGSGNLSFQDVHALFSASSPLTYSGGVLGIPASTNSVNGYLTSADHATFAAKQNALTFGNLTSPTTGVAVSGGTGAVIGTGVTLSVQNATGSQPGLLTGADWATFNGKQNALTFGSVTSTTTGVSITGGTGAVIGSGMTLNIQTASSSQPGLLSAADRASFATSATATTNATNANTPSTLVLRDSSGNFSAGTMTGNLTGNVTGAVTGHSSLDLALTGGTMSGTLSMGSNKITNVLPPTGGTDAANKNYVDNAISGLSWRPKANLFDATDTTKPTTTSTTIDGQTIANGNRVLFTALTTGNNAVYVATVSGSAVTWTLALDGQNLDGTPALGDSLLIEAGTAYAQSSWTFGGAAWIQFNGAGQIQAGTGLSKSGNTLYLTSPVSTTNGGTGQTTVQASMDALAQATTTASYLRGNGSHVVMSPIQAGDVPTLNQSTTGTAANVTGVVATANGGTGVNGSATFPTSGTVDTTSSTATLTNKTLTSPVINSASTTYGTASSSSYLSLPSASLSTLTGLTRAAGKLYYATDQTKAYIDTGSALTPVGSGSGSGSVQNLVSDPSFENSSGLTNSGGTTAFTTTAANVGVGATSAQWTPAATTALGQWVGSSAITIPAGDYSRNGAASLIYRGDASATNGTPYLQAVDGSGNVLGQVALVTNTTAYQRATVNFIFPSSGTVAWRITTTATSGGSPTAIYIDDVYLGAADGFNISSVSQAQLLGTVKMTGCAAMWATTSATYTDFPTQSGCVYTTTGQALAPTTNIPAIKFASLPPGEYKLEYEGSAYAGAVGADAYYQFWDGTNTAREQSQLEGVSTAIASPSISQSISYTTAQSNVTLSIRALSAASSLSVQLGGMTANPGVIRVYYYPSQSQTAIRMDSTPGSWQGHFSSCGWSYTPTSAFAIAPGAASGCALTEDWNRNFGAVSAVTDGTGPRPSVSFTVPRAGRYFACFTHTFQRNTAGGWSFQSLRDESGYQIDYADDENMAAASRATHKLCGVVNWGVGSHQLSLYSSNNGDGSVWTWQTGVHTVSIISLDTPMPAPYLTGSVSSNTSGQERVERATISGDGSCTVQSQSGAWIASKAHPATGECDITMAGGIFSASPACVCTPADFGSPSYFNCVDSVSSATLFRTGTTSFSASGGAGTPVDRSFSVICMGPR